MVCLTPLTLVYPSGTQCLLGTKLVKETLCADESWENIWHLTLMCHGASMYTSLKDACESFPEMHSGPLTRLTASAHISGPSFPLAHFPLSQS